MRIGLLHEKVVWDRMIGVPIGLCDGGDESIFLEWCTVADWNPQILTTTCAVDSLSDVVVFVRVGEHPRSNRHFETRNASLHLKRNGVRFCTVDETSARARRARSQLANDRPLTWIEELNPGLIRLFSGRVECGITSTWIGSANRNVASITLGKRRPGSVTTGLYSRIGTMHQNQGGRLVESGNVQWTDISPSAIVSQDRSARGWRLPR